MKKILAVSLLLSLFLTGCSLGTKTKNSENKKPATRIIDLKDSSFMPATLVIKEGETIVWTNRDDFSHKLKADDFKSGKLESNETFSYTFKKKGSYSYTCVEHPGMKGAVIVE